MLPTTVGMTNPLARDVSEIGFFLKQNSSSITMSNQQQQQQQQQQQLKSCSWLG
jgi:hypothetical protein